MQHRAVDIVIPLGSGSRYNNFELRMALRSISRYAMNIRHIYIVSAALPGWLCNVKTLNIADCCKHNKDANIINKVQAAAALPELSEKFIFWSDDQLALHQFDAANLPVSCNLRKYEHFNSEKIWHRRMRNTFEFLQKNNIKLDCNFDSHLPMPMYKKQFCKIMQKVNYHRQPGYCINTLYCGMSGIKGGIPQNQIKYTAETAINLKELPKDKLFIGYNDEAMKSNLPELLQEHFREKCKYESA